MNINWYPGHMVTAFKEIKENLKLVDVVVELLDSRIPLSSQNLELEDIIQGKKLIKVLNKSDLANDMQTKKWIEYFKKKEIESLAIQSHTGKGINEVLKKIERLMKEELEIQAKRGRVGKPIRVLVVGIPNVGKSSFINRLSKRTSAKVGNKPGVTKKNQWIRVNDKIDLLDTPGVLWLKFDTKTQGLNLAYIGTIKDEIMDIGELGINLVNDLLKIDKELLIKRYNLNKEELEKTNNTKDVLELIAKKRGALIQEGEVDYIKVSNLLINDFRQGNLGKITLEII